MRAQYDPLKADRIIDALRELTSRGACPTVRELAERAGIPRSTVHRYIEHLIGLGRVVNKASAPRTLTLVPWDNEK